MPDEPKAWERRRACPARAGMKLAHRPRNHPSGVAVPRPRVYAPGARDPSGWVLGTCIGGSIIAAVAARSDGSFAVAGRSPLAGDRRAQLVAAGIGARAWSTPPSAA